MSILHSAKLEHPTNKNLSIEFIAHFEDIEIPENHFENKVDIDFAYKHKSGWFTAEIRVYHRDFEELRGVDYLGCCSYISFEDFIKGDCFTDMVNTATIELMDKIKTVKDLQL